MKRGPTAGQIRDEPAPGSQLVVSRRGYRHHGIYVGAGRVIHYAGRIRYPHGLVEEVSLTEFSDGRPFRTRRIPNEQIGATIVRRARSRLGERGYDLLRNNCEHFCNWCLVGEPRSAQVESLTWFGRLLLCILERLALLVMSSVWAAETSCSAMRQARSSIDHGFFSRTTGL